VLVSTHLLQESLKHLLFLLPVIGPEVAPRLRVVPNDDHADQVDKSFFRQPLDIQVHRNRTGGDFRCPEDIHPPVADRHGLESVGAATLPLCRPFALASAPECAGQLSERKDASPSVGFDLVLMDTPKEADVVLPNRLVVVTLTELA